MRLVLCAIFVSGLAFAGGSVQGTVTVTRDGKPAFVKNTLIYLRGFKSSPPKEPARMAQTGRAFDKVVLPVVKQGKVSFTNEEPLDSVYHHVFSPDKKTQINSSKYKPGDKPYVTKEMTNEGPITVFCDIHKDMISTVYVVPNDSYTLLGTAEGASAQFKIQNIPPGSWTIVAWHRSAKQATELPVVVKDGQATKIDLAINGESGLEELLKNHQNRGLKSYEPPKLDGGARGEKVGVEDDW